MDVKLFLVALGLIAFFWLITMPGRRRRRATKDDRTQRKAHNSRMVHYKGFRESVTEEGHRKVHAKKRAGAMDCSDECPYCAKGAEYQASLRVFDDRPIRGRRQRRRVLRGEVDE